LRALRRVVPVAQTVTIGGVLITLFSVDDYVEGFALRLRLLLTDDHPVAREHRTRDADFWRQRTEAVQRGAVAEFEAAQQNAFLGGTQWSLPSPEWAPEAHDDRGHLYQPGYGGEARWSSALEGWVEAHFIPALQPPARALQVQVPTVHWSRHRRHELGAIEMVDQGPWVFDVPL
jgi:hypothetical protein